MKMKRLISWMLVLVLVAGLLPISTAPTTADAAEPETLYEGGLEVHRLPTMGMGVPITNEDKLRVENGRLYNEKNEEVVLRGHNTGGWMLQESWMCAVYGTDKYHGNLDTFKGMRRAGWTEEQIQQAFATYQDNFFREEDLNYMHCHDRKGDPEYPINFKKIDCIIE